MTISDTIYALSTPPGRGALAVIRVSGDRAAESIRCLTGKEAGESRKAVLRTFRSGGGAVIDRGLALYFRGPSSYTGEDMAEFHLHGGLAVVSSMMAALSEIPGLRQAEPGEFTRRAFENGRMDLTEAEAVADLIDAETEAQRIQAMSQLGGSLSQLYNDWRGRLSRVLAYMEADLDFSDEDLPDSLFEKARPELEIITQEIRRHLDDNHRGERLRCGVHVAVIGAPNAGKSSLVNVLARREAAIVSEFAGTTRDVIEVHLDLGGYPVILADTAGLRPEQLGEGDQALIEREGIRRALKRAEESDIRLLIFDGGKLPSVDFATYSLMDRNSLLVVNKVDGGMLELPEELSGRAVQISAKTGFGLPELVNALTERISELLGAVSQNAPALTRERHRRSIENCSKALDRSFTARLPELAAEDVRLALRELGRITGRVDVEDLLDIIFRDFCIGK